MADRELLGRAVNMLVSKFRGSLERMGWLWMDRMGEII